MWGPPDGVAAILVCCPHRRMMSKVRHEQRMSYGCPLAAACPLVIRIWFGPAVAVMSRLDVFEIQLTFPCSLWHLTATPWRAHPSQGRLPHPSPCWRYWEMEETLRDVDVVPLGRTQRSRQNPCRAAPCWDGSAWRLCGDGRGGRVEMAVDWTHDGWRTPALAPRCPHIHH